MTVIVLQARLDSSRLPGKSMLPLAGRPLIFRVMEALSAICAGSSAGKNSGFQKILACPGDCAAVFSPLAEEAGFDLVQGPKDDVLARYCIAARKTGGTRIIRATGDNPFVFADAALALNLEAETLNSDYAVYTEIPHGSGVESISAAALFRAENEAKESSEREHVCPYLYNNPKLFKLHRPRAPLRWQGAEINLSIDNSEDYKRSRILFGELLSLPKEKRHIGENIIAAYKRIFNAGGNEK